MHDSGESKSIRHWCVVLTIQLGEVKDVVAQYHHHNHGPRLPDNAQLMAIYNQQTSEASCHVSQSEVDDLDNLETPIDPPTSQTSPSTTDVILSTHSCPPPPASPTTAGIMPDGNSDPSQLQFYTPPVHDIIEHTKQISHCDIASVNLFPLHADFNHKASEYMNEAIAECCSQGLPILNGRCQWSFTRIKTWCIRLQRVVAPIHTWYYEVGTYCSLNEGQLLKIF